MNIFQKLNYLFLKKYSVSKPRNADVAYDLWADYYDSQPDNMMLAWDEEIFSGLINNLDLGDKVIADIGCGTGRHWKKIFARQPKKLIGFDVSEGMLKVLQQKFPFAETHHLKNDELKELENESCDIIISTLTIAHIENAEKALHEWNRILKPGGELIITDYHPIALAKGGKRTFKRNGKTISVKNYVHSIEKLKDIARQLHLKVFRLKEKSIDESARPFYEKQHALPMYETWKGTPIIYGIHLKKPDETL
ncbi:MAG: class I SAM-dependent methyltransferase [Ginsengibacter sp.]